MSQYFSNYKTCNKLFPFSFKSSLVFLILLSTTYFLFLSKINKYIILIPQPSPNFLSVSWTTSPEPRLLNHASSPLRWSYFSFTVPICFSSLFVSLPYLILSPFVLSTSDFFINSPYFLLHCQKKSSTCYPQGIFNGLFKFIFVIWLDCHSKFPMT